MPEMSVAEALEPVYTSLNGDNEDIDLHIDNLRKAAVAAGLGQVSVDPARLTYNNRQGRKLMQSYFRKRGVVVVFQEKTEK